MPRMSAIEAAFCRAAPWKVFSQRVLLPWALDGHVIFGEVLEVGAGSGAMAEAAARRFPEASITVTDVDAAMVAVARARLAPLPNLRVRAADMTSLPFATDRFDAAMSNLVLHHVISWRDGAAEALRVLKPGGVLLGYDLTNTLLARFVHHADRSPHRMVSAEELLEGLAAAGFTGVNVQEAARDHLMRFRAYKPVRTRTGVDAPLPPG